MARPAEVIDEFDESSLVESVVDITCVPDDQSSPKNTSYFKATGLPAVSLTLAQDFSMVVITLSGRGT
jgi:hypothetical protein